MDAEPLKNNQRSIFARLTGWAGAPYVALILAVLLAYANVYHNEFVFDDLSLITGNKFLTSWHYLGTLFVACTECGNGIPDPFYRPLVMLLYFLVYQAAGPSIIAFHLLNVTLHILNTCLLYTLGVRMGFQRGGVLLATLLWALHPVQTEAVTYMSGTLDPLCGAFLLSGILVLLPGFSRRRVCEACGLFALGLLSKETAVIFPVLAMALLFYRSENRWHWRSYLKTWPFWLLLIPYFAVRSAIPDVGNLLHYNKLAAGMGLDMGLGTRFCTFLATLPVYLRLLVWPSGLHLVRSFPIYRSLWTPRVLAGLAVLVMAFTGIVWKPKQRATPLSWGLLWAAATYFPVSGILVQPDILIAERWLYLPTMGLALGLEESLARRAGALRFRSALAGFTILAALASGTATFEHNKTWRDPLTLYKHVLDCGDDSAKMRGNLGMAYLDKGLYGLAIEQFRHEVAFAENDANAHYYLGYALIREATMDPLSLNSAELDEATGNFQRALALNPDYYDACDALRIIYANLGDHAKEAEYAVKAAAIRKKRADLGKP